MRFSDRRHVLKSTVQGSGNLTERGNSSGTPVPLQDQRADRSGKGTLKTSTCLWKAGFRPCTPIIRDLKTENTFCLAGMYHAAISHLWNSTTPLKKRQIMYLNSLYSGALRAFFFFYHYLYFASDSVLLTWLDVQIQMSLMDSKKVKIAGAKQIYWQFCSLMNSNFKYTQSKHMYRSLKTRSVEGIPVQDILLTST